MKRPNEVQSSFSHQSCEKSTNNDWICVNCSNLNYSFRKKCNRCKVQSREDNDKCLQQKYHYYQQFYNYNLNTYTCENRDPQPCLTQNCIKTPRSRKENDYIKKIVLSEKELPSVSPLIKRYNASVKLRRGASDNNIETQHTFNQNIIFAEESWKQFYSDQLATNCTNQKETDQSSDQQSESGSLLTALSLMII